MVSLRKLLCTDQFAQASQRMNPASRNDRKIILLTIRFATVQCAAKIATLATRGASCTEAFTYFVRIL